MNNTRLGSAQYVTAASRCDGAFYVIVTQCMMVGNGDGNCLDLNEGDIFICTYFNKIGYWWGVSVYDLQRQGWFPSTFVQPYTGEVTEEAADLVKQLTRITEPSVQAQGEEAGVDEAQPEKKFNIVIDDSHKYQEYELTGAIERKGRRLNVTDQPDTGDRIENEDFDYEAWGDARNASALLDSSKRSRNN